MPGKLCLVRNGKVGERRDKADIFSRVNPDLPRRVPDRKGKNGNQNKAQVDNDNKFRLF